MFDVSPCNCGAALPNGWWGGLMLAAPLNTRVSFWGLFVGVRKGRTRASLRFRISWYCSSPRHGTCLATSLLAACFGNLFAAFSAPGRDRSLFSLLLLQGDRSCREDYRRRQGHLGAQEVHQVGVSFVAHAWCSVCLSGPTVSTSVIGLRTTCVGGEIKSRSDARKSAAEAAFARERARRL